MRYSSRSAFETSLNRLARRLAERRRLALPVLDLTESNPTRAGLAVPDAWMGALDTPDAAAYRPEPAGLRGAREAVAGYYRERGFEVCARDVFLTASTSEAYGWLFKLLADPGDCVLTPRPGYPLFDYLAALESVRIARYPLQYHGGWYVDLDAVGRGLASGARAVVCVSPNNPTGSFLRVAEWERLAELCGRYSAALVVDEVFSDYPLRFPEAAGAAPGSALLGSAAGRHDCLNFVLSGLSKVLCLPQMKLAWLVVQGPAEARREARARLEMIADTFLPVNTPVQLAAGTWLAQRRDQQARVLARIQANLECLARLCRASPAGLLEAEGGWYAVLQVPRVRSEEEWVLTLLEEDQVLVHPGYFYDFSSEAYLVVSLLPRPETFEQAAARLMARVLA